LIQNNGSATLRNNASDYNLVITNTGASNQWGIRFTGDSVSHLLTTFNSTTGGNFSGTSLPRTNSILYSGGLAGASTNVIAGTPIVNVIGSTSTNIGTRLDSLGLRIGTLADVHTSNTVAFEMGESMNMKFGTTTGTKIGTASSQKISLWNATPIVQPTTGIAASTFVANTSGIVNDTATFDGYTIGQVVKALRNIGALA